MGETELRVRFFGVRGSTPCSAPDQNRYGGATSCVVVEPMGADPIILDAGTGIRRYGLEVIEQAPDVYRASILLSHLHWDHIQGMPFFSPLHVEGTEINLYGPGDCGKGFKKLVHKLMRPPFFPITPSEVKASLKLHQLDVGDLSIGDTKVRTRHIPHTGCTNGYRIDHHGVSIAFVPDHQQPVDRPTFVDEQVLDLCDGVDLLIHDAQFTDDEFAARNDWGHCTAGYALEVARQSGAKSLALFHHDPFHNDTQVDEILAATRTLAPPALQVFAAASGLDVDLSLNAEPVILEDS